MSQLQLQLRVIPLQYNIIFYFENFGSGGRGRQGPPPWSRHWLKLRVRVDDSQSNTVKRRRICDILKQRADRVRVYRLGVSIQTRIDRNAPCIPRVFVTLHDVRVYTVYDGVGVGGLWCPKEIRGRYHTPRRAICTGYAIYYIVMFRELLRVLRVVLRRRVVCGVWCVRAGHAEILALYTIREKENNAIDVSSNRNERTYSRGRSKGWGRGRCPRPPRARNMKMKNVF